MFRIPWAFYEWMEEAKKLDIGIRLCRATAATLRQGLNLLGIETPERI